MEGIGFSLGGYQDEDGSINMTLSAGDKLNITIRYTDSDLAHSVISNLSYIISDLLDDALDEALGEYTEYDMDEELRKILEEGK